MGIVLLSKNTDLPVLVPNETILEGPSQFCALGSLLGAIEVLKYQELRWDCHMNGKCPDSILVSSVP